MRSYLKVAIIGALFLVGPARAENQLPTAEYQETLIKNSLLTLNDANVTGIYEVLHAKLSKPFRDQFTPDKLKEIFKTFVDQKADWAFIAAKPPVPTGEATIDERGALHLRGYFDTKPSRLNYDINYVPSEGQWKPLGINVTVKPEKEN
jgi:hypothetical protein